MKRSATLLTVLLLSLGSSVFAQGEAKADGAAKAEQLKAQINSLELELKAAQSKLAEAADRLAGRQAEIAKASAKARKVGQLVRSDQKALEAAIAKQMQAVEEVRSDKRLRMRDLLQSVEAKQGAEHAYAQAIRSGLMEEAVRLQAELARASQQFAPQHPQVVALRKQLEHLKVAARDAAKAKGIAQGKQAKAKMTEKAIKADMSAYKAEYAALKELGAAMEKSQYRQQMEGRMEQVAKELAAIETKMQLARKGEVREVEFMQAQRLQELLQMEQRLKRAEDLSTMALTFDKKAAASQSKRQPESGNDMTNNRFDRLEQKLDKIASLLEKMIERDKE